MPKHGDSILRAASAGPRAAKYCGNHSNSGLRVSAFGGHVGPWLRRTFYPWGCDPRGQHSGLGRVSSCRGALSGSSLRMRGWGHSGPQFHHLGEDTCHTALLGCAPHVLCQRACCVRGQAGGRSGQRSFRCGWTGGQGWWCERQAREVAGGWPVLLRLQPSPVPGPRAPLWSVPHLWVSLSPWVSVPPSRALSLWLLSLSLVSSSLGLFLSLAFLSVPLSLSLWSVSLSVFLTPSRGLWPPVFHPPPPQVQCLPAAVPRTLGRSGLELPGTASAGARANQLCCAAALHRATWTIKPKLALKVEVLSVLRGSEGICMSEQYVKGAIPSDCSGLSFGLHVGVGKDFTKPQRNVSMKFFLVLASSLSLFFGHSNEKSFPGLQISPVSLGNRSWRPGPAGG